MKLDEWRQNWRDRSMMLSVKGRKMALNWFSFEPLNFSPFSGKYTHNLFCSDMSQRVATISTWKILKFSQVQNFNPLYIELSFMMLLSRHMCAWCARYRKMKSVSHECEEWKLERSLQQCRIEMSWKSNLISVYTFTAHKLSQRFQLLLSHFPSASLTNGND
jgi:hypothetical protein